MEHPDKLINNFKGKLLLHGPSAARASANETARAADRAASPPPQPDHHQSSKYLPTGEDSSFPGDINHTAAAEGAKARAIGTGEGPSNRVEGDSSGTGVSSSVKGGSSGTGRDDEGGEGERGKGASSSAEGTSEPISPDMILLRGCVLRNTRWVLGLVLNTGPDTKIMMSMSKVRECLRGMFVGWNACGVELFVGGMFVGGVFMGAMFMGGMLVGGMLVGGMLMGGMLVGEFFTFWGVYNEHAYGARIFGRNVYG